MYKIILHVYVYMYIDLINGFFVTIVFIPSLALSDTVSLGFSSCAGIFGVLKHVK